MDRQIKSRQRIMIAEGDAQRRKQLCEILGQKYEVLIAPNGKEAIALLEERGYGLSLLLLNGRLDHVSGLEVLDYMNRYHWIEDFPVIMIDGEEESNAAAFEKGAADSVELPLSDVKLLRRVANVIALYARNRRLTDIATDQIYQKERGNQQMVGILSHIMEFRNGESGQHVRHIGVITERLLRRLVRKTDKYHLTVPDILRISTASALHDIGKISIDEKLLNKSEALTEQEFAIMKTHTIVGERMLDNLPFQQSDLMVQDARAICRWHHERYDGKGYPDGLVGDEIPIAAQVVAMADVYDALTSTRSYKEAYPHGRAVRMILDGQCGAFNPLLLDCLREIADDLKRTLQSDSPQLWGREVVRELTDELLRHDVLSPGAQILRQVEIERAKTRFFESALSDVCFSYQVSPPMLNISSESAARMGLDLNNLDMLNNEDVLSRLQRSTAQRVIELAKKTTPEHPHFSVTGTFLMNGKECWCRCSCQALWTSDDEPRYAGIVGRIINLEDKYSGVAAVGEAAYHEAMSNVRDGEIEDDDQVNGRQAWQLCQYLGRAFDMVRLVDIHTHVSYDITRDGQLIPNDTGCFTLWNRQESCKDCISERTIARKRRMTKFEFVNDELYHVVAQYIEVDGTPYALEMVARISDETLLGGYGQNPLMETISSHNEKLYLDPLTGVYNRRYYEEQLHGLTSVDAVVMLDVDDFKRVNDTYGHLAGDQALKVFSETVRSLVRHSDSLVRYGGDEFVLVFRTIPQEVLRNKLNVICERIAQMQLEGYPELHMTVSIGAKYGPGGTAEMLLEADRLMYEAKKTKNSARME